MLLFLTALTESLSAITGSYGISPQPHAIQKTAAEHGPQASCCVEEGNKTVPLRANSTDVHSFATPAEYAEYLASSLSLAQRQALISGPRDKIMKDLGSAKSCGFSKAYVRPVRKNDLPSGAVVNPKWQTIDAGESVIQRLGELSCFMNQISESKKSH